MSYDVAIVGGGAAGVLTAIHLLRTARRPMRIVLFEKSPEIGEGIAYGTRRAEHVLNVTASRMSAHEADASHFVRYLLDASPTLDMAKTARAFIGRRRYGAYLRDALQTARDASAASLTILHDEIVAIDIKDDVRLVDRSCRAMEAATCVLALGNRAKIYAPADAVADAAPVAAWDADAIARFGADDTVTIVGTGLSMIDVLLTLIEERHRGTIHVVSRKGLLPQSHAPHGASDIDIEALLRATPAKRAGLLRAAAERLRVRGDPWQWVMDSVRPHVVSLWKSLDRRAQRRFLRHASGYWDVHRHRIAPDVAAKIAALADAGRLVVHAGRITRVEHDDGRWRVSVQARGETARSVTIVSHQLVGAIGMNMDVSTWSDPLMRSMLARGIARPGPHGIGLDVDAGGRVVDAEGRASERLYALGSVRVGSEWESVAVPEIRAQAAAIAAAIAS